jgi:hypothetical protein
MVRRICRCLILWFLASGRRVTLKEALEKAKSNLPQGEVSAFGLSNVLMFLNGLLRYKHPDFTSEMLDDIERFLDGLNEHSFQIPEKLAAIPTARLLQPSAKAKQGNGSGIVPVDETEKSVVPSDDPLGSQN